MGYDVWVKQVVAEAKKRIGRTTICIDGLRHYFDTYNFEGAVQHAINQTYYWDGE